ncbi:hypothetical protein EKN06_12335 [Croceicoccus ponticola]|uniref:DUF4145 domain-containing protein n=1 Tax=Croceicoccus ponticola TaxID=2217664 RepID=A0A437GVA1_9SPHN|nr:hypothetical protein [Croceicoccus ponticola]RVQ65716.1 hypothetical protein EKN06_12335 [Croceicoccus ponticola]
MTTSRKEVIKGLKVLSQVATEDLDQEQFARHLVAESDRGVIMLSATMVDDALRNVLVERFQRANKDERETLFNGPAGNFASRTLLAKALGIIDQETKGNIDLLRHMRNACAHAQNDLNFQSPEIQAAIQCLVADSSVPLGQVPPPMMRGAFVLYCRITAHLIRFGAPPESFDAGTDPFLSELMQGLVDQWATQTRVGLLKLEG